MEPQQTPDNQNNQIPKHFNPTTAGIKLWGLYSHEWIDKRAIRNGMWLYKPYISKAEAGPSMWVQVQPSVLRKFQASQSYIMGFCLRQNNRNIRD